MRKYILISICLLIMATPVLAKEMDPLSTLAQDTVSLFTPFSAEVLKTEGRTVFLSAGKGVLRPGMRMKILREGEPFRHPVTKQLIGKIEAAVGAAEVKEASVDPVVAAVLEGEPKAGDKVRIPDAKVRLLFCQDRGVDWYIADDYYRKLKASGRIELIDTALETADEAIVLAEAKRLGAEAAIILTSKGTANAPTLEAGLYWVSDGRKFASLSAAIGPEYSKELKYGGTYFSPGVSDAVMTFNLGFRARLIASGDFDGDGIQEIMLSSGRELFAFRLGADLKPLWEIKGKTTDDFIWLDAVDINGNGRDEVLLTSMRGAEVISSIYEFSGDGFKLLWEGKYFLRRLGKGSIAQAYSSAEGFSRDILKLAWNGDYRVGKKIKTPKGVNIYDFVIIEGGEAGPMTFAYDEKGFLNLYDEKGLRIWQSGTDTGGFLSTFKKSSTVSYLEGGEWSVKDRLIQIQREIMVMQRIPFANVSRSIGYRKSMIKSFWWNGLSMDETTSADGIQGAAMDYAVSGDKLLVISNPFMGIKFENILKGERMIGSTLSVYSVKGR